MSGVARVWLISGVAAVVVAGGIVAVLVMRGGNSPAPTTTTTAAPTTTAVAGPACPLSGVPSGAGGVPPRPALAVKIDNYPAARPQSGLEQADVVFEEPVEGGITRLVAVFQCQSPPLIGPVRSARAIDAQIVDELSHPLFFHVGGIGPVLSIISAADDVNLDLGYHGSVIQHPPGRYAPYNTYFSAAAGWGLDAGDTTQPAPLFTYADTPPAGTPLSSIHIPFAPTNDVTWNWDAPSKKWLLSYSGTPATVATGAQIAAANVVVQTVQVSYGPWVENAQGGLEVQARLTGSGPLLVLRDGEEISGTWQRAATSAPTMLVASNGTTIPLKPGLTWVELVPSAVGVSSH
ncbi:MAG TPA: DUF3048 domain-containing protein [Acidimicrobiales bacterium]|nr:DUF3048 domain-containing protein [Acidimicrobiales bacterium]